jgi:hypothetical protein
MATTQGTIGTDAVGSPIVKNERQRAKLAGLSLIASPVLWLIGAVAFRSVVGGFYENDETLAKLGALTGHSVAWVVQSLIFFAGTLAAVIGLGLLAGILQQTRATLLGRIGMVGIVAVTAVNAFIMFLRLAAPTDGAGDAVEASSLLMASHFGWLGSVNAALTLLTVVVYGAALFWTERAKVTGVVVVTLSTLIFVAMLTSGTHAPIAYYPIVAILGVRLLFGKALLMR